jgi:drug/metabolite transporter (DMT)-like permease
VAWTALYALMGGASWLVWREGGVGAHPLPLALYALVTGVSWSVAWSPAYVISLLYLAVFGSVIAFGLYFTIARARGYATASYISALTPPIAVIMSVLFEGAEVGVTMLVGLALVLVGQVLLIRAPKAA